MIFVELLRYSIAKELGGAKLTRRTLSTMRIQTVSLVSLELKMLTVYPE